MSLPAAVCSLNLPATVALVTGAGPCNPTKPLKQSLFCLSHRPSLRHLKHVHADSHAGTEALRIACSKIHGFSGNDSANGICIIAEGAVSHDTIGTCAASSDASIAVCTGTAAQETADGAGQQAATAKGVSVGEKADAITQSPGSDRGDHGAETVSRS